MTRRSFKVPFSYTFYCNLAAIFWFDEGTFTEKIHNSTHIHQKKNIALKIGSKIASACNHLNKTINKTRAGRHYMEFAKFILSSVISYDYANIITYKAQNYFNCKQKINEILP